MLMPESLGRRGLFPAHAHWGKKDFGGIFGCNLTSRYGLQGARTVPSQQTVAISSDS
jgi:hypothetical protein